MRLLKERWAAIHREHVTPDDETDDDCGDVFDELEWREHHDDDF